MKNIKSWNQFNRINELRTETYAKVMDRTEGYPWRMTTKDDHGNYNVNPKAEQEGRINKLSRERFIQEFMKEFPERSTVIYLNEVPYEFVALKFISNWTNYYLMFQEQGKSGRIYIHPHRADGYYIEKLGQDNVYKSSYETESDDTGLDARSEDLVLDMLKYMRG